MKVLIWWEGESFDVHEDESLLDVLDRMNTPMLKEVKNLCDQLINANCEHEPLIKDDGEQWLNVNNHAICKRCKELIKPTGWKQL